MKTLLYLIGLVVLLAPGAAWAQSQLTTSFAQRQINEKHYEAQLIRCDVSSSIAGDSAIGGETCVSGDWSRAIDCRGATNISMMFFEYGTGSAQAYVWNCLSVPGGPPAAPSTAGGTVPGTEAPGGTPGPTDPDPLCVELAAAANVLDFDGLAGGTQMINEGETKLHFIVGEIEDCTNNCDSTLVVSCGR
jgi:hypothetical protein